MAPVTGVVLAGGGSTRMGQEKTSLSFSGQSLLERVLDVLGQATQDIVMVTSRPMDVPGARLVLDLVPGRGPLAGIHAGLKASTGWAAFVVACDMPFLSPGLIRHMISLGHGYQVVVPFVKGQYEPMHALYSRECLGPIESALEDPHPRIVQFFPEVLVRKVSHGEIARFGRPERIFFNANTPEDLERAFQMEAGDNHD
ncbi:MAG: molybdenum cofactor guanylyltransferase [Bacillota bacterium]